MNRNNQQVERTDELRTLPQLLRAIADRYEAWATSLSLPPTDDERQWQELHEETFGPDPHPLVGSLQRAVDSGLIEKACNWLLTKGCPDAADKLTRQHNAGMAWLKECLLITTSPVSDKNKPAVNLALIDLFVVSPMVMLCRDLADGFEAQHKAPDEPSSLDTLPDDTRLSVRELSELSGIDCELLRKRLERFRKSRDDCFVEIANRKSTEPQFLYTLGPVRPLIAQLKPSIATSSTRPATKKSR